MYFRLFDKTTQTIDYNYYKGGNKMFNFLRNMFKPKELKKPKVKVSKKRFSLAVLDCITKNEVSGNLKIIYRFIRAKQGTKSGWSFGRMQFDVKHSKTARIFLEQNGFSKDEIGLLRYSKTLKTSVRTKLNKKLLSIKEKVDELDEKHLAREVKYVREVFGTKRCKDWQTLMHVIDYHNQFYLSPHGKMMNYFKERNSVSSEDILNFKLNNTKWGKVCRSDVMRRYRNIVDLCEQYEFKDNEWR